MRIAGPLTERLRNIWNHEVPIYGERAPQHLSVLIQAEFKSRAEFIGDASELRPRGETTIYRNLHVRREDFDRYLRKIVDILIF
jgi:hypothetical protein